MGNQISNSNAFNHPLLGICYFSDTRILKPFRFPSPEDSLLWDQHLTQVKSKINCDGLFLPSRSSIREQSLCGQVECWFEFQSWPCTLQQDILRRALTSNPYHQIDIWNLGQFLARTACSFDRLGIKACAIAPSQILLNPARNKLKLACQFTFPGFHTGYYDYLDKRIGFPSPEELLQINYQSQHGSNITFLNKVGLTDVFSIGLTLLQCVLLQELKLKVYRELTIDERALAQKLNRLGTSEFSQGVKKVIRDCLTMSESKRLRASQLLQTCLNQSISSK